ncbi:helix-turn-helix domain-containing protein [Streptomyces sp. V4I2]|uniref:helix-turn-helix domain-containing protein n=1 Tax=Streptomyces sp. V4I2 TaxID=3042280 RepID=UPI002786CD9A|nr:helix-turn-helix domain-containing protein [Streptomyces sp. V4I2]MDQ1044307.1 hypothetical protein [Streptomyces sp. V4I2]
MLNVNGTRYLTTAETAERLGLSAGHLRNQRSDGRSPLPFVRIGPSVFYAEADVIRLAEERNR